jgi:hypothetical protein
MIISPSNSQGPYFHLKKLQIPASSQMIRPLFMHFRMTIFFRQFLGIQHTYLRVEEVTLGISFNTQSQAPDIPNISSRAAMIEYTLPLNTTQNDPDISSLPLRTLKQELSASLNAQSQAHDDPFHSQDSSRAPRDSLYNSPFFSHVFQSLPTRISTDPLQPLYIPTTRHIHPFLPGTVSQGHAHLPPRRIQ